MKYYSEKLDKIFDTQEALTEAEEKHEAEQAKKAEAKALVAKESAEVTEAFKARNAARKAYNEKLVEARKVYNEALKQARHDFEEALSESTDDLDKAEADYDSKLKAFQKAHPEGYHLTLKDGDNVITYTSRPTEILDTARDFDTILDVFSDFIRRW